MSAGYWSHGFCWACGSDLRQFVSQDDVKLGETVGDITGEMRHILRNRIDAETPEKDLLQGLHVLCQLEIRLRKLFSLHRMNCIEMYSLGIRKAIIGQSLAWLQDWPHFFTKDLLQRGITRASFNGQYSSLPSWIRLVVDGPLARQNRGVNKEVAEHTFLQLQSELGRTPRQSDMRRILGDAGERHVRALVEKRTEVTDAEIEVMQRRAVVLSRASQNRVDRQRAFRKGVFFLSISAYSGRTLKELVEMSEHEILDLAHCTPSALTSWLWGEASTNIDQIPALTAGAARHLLKLSRSCLRLILEPLPDDVLRSETVMQRAINR